MRPGHTLLIPKTHVVRLADLDPASAGKMGMALPKVVNAVCEATGNPDLNVVCNQGESSRRVSIRFGLVGGVGGAGGVGLGLIVSSGGSTRALDCSYAQGMRRRYM